MVQSVVKAKRGERTEEAKGRVDLTRTSLMTARDEGTSLNTGIDGRKRGRTTGKSQEGQGPLGHVVVCPTKQVVLLLWGLQRQRVFFDDNERERRKGGGLKGTLR